METLSEVTVTQLREANISIAKLMGSHDDAVKKRKIIKARLKQGATAFTRSESSNMEYKDLTSPEQFALTVIAYDQYMLHASKTWQQETWPLPKWMLAKGVAIFPKSDRLVSLEEAVTMIEKK